MSALEAIIVSVKSVNTAIVTVNYVYPHPKYKKILRRRTKLAVHNEISGLKAGDKVRLVKSRPYSRTKHFKVTEVISG